MSAITFSSLMRAAQSAETSTPSPKKSGHGHSSMVQGARSAGPPVTASTWSLR